MQPLNSDDQIDNPLRNGNEGLTLSIFNRPCNNNYGKSSQNIIEYGNVKADDHYRQFSLTTTKGLFNPKLNMENNKKV